MKYEEIKSRLQNAIDAGSIYNVDFQSIKHKASREYESESRVFSGDHRYSLQFERMTGDLKNAELAYSLMHIESSVRKINKAAERVEAEYGGLNEFDKAMLADANRISERWSEIVAMIKAVKPTVIKGRKPAENPNPTKPKTAASADHNGTCPFCGRAMAVSKRDGTLASHGYRVVYGMHEGRCAGSGKLPVEVDTASCDAFIERLTEQAFDARDILETMPNGTIKEIEAISNIKFQIRSLQLHVRFIEQLKASRYGKPLYPRPE